MTERDLWSAASVMDESRGEEAMAFIAARVFNLSLAGNEAGAQVWLSIMLRLAAIRRLAPLRSEKLQ